MSRSFRVVVLAGGDSAEREVSMASGAQVAEALLAAGHQVRLVDPADTDLADVDFSRVDGCFLALHGGAGEDGRIQRRLQELGVPYTGSGPAASRAGMSKSLCKELFRQCGVPTPDYVLIEPGDSAEPSLARKVASIGFPVVIKPDAGGSSLGVGVARSRDDLPRLVAQSRRFGPLVIAERYVRGREMTVSVLGRCVLPLLEVLTDREIFDYRLKYSGSPTQCRFQTGLPPITLEELRKTALGAADALGTAGLIRVDMLLDDRMKVWVLEVNTLPGMTAHSMAPRAAARDGMDMPQLCDWMIKDAIDRRVTD
jgi:D-alanine-D-alanine ligase